MSSTSAASSGGSSSRTDRTAFSMAPISRVIASRISLGPIRMTLGIPVVRCLPLTFRVLFPFGIEQAVPIVVFIFSVSLSIGRSHRVRMRSEARKSMLAGIDIDSVQKKLKELMEVEKVYCDEKMSLKTLSSMLSITPHQLSELLNEKLNMNFHTFINNYRVDEAKTLLIEEQEGSVISIAW